MLKHNLLMIVRNIKRNKSSFFINLIGLSAGLFCTIMIYLWVNDELSVDKFHEKDKQLYQVMQNFYRPDGMQTLENTPGLLAEALAKEFPEIEYSAAVMSFGGKGILSLDNHQIQASDNFVSQDFFHIFSYPLLRGNADQVLSDPNSIVLSDEMAVKLFGSVDDAVGKTVKWDKVMWSVSFPIDYKISGVFEKPPSNSSVQFDVLCSYELLLERWSENLVRWTNHNPHTYLVLHENTNIYEFNAKIKDFIQTKNPNTSNTLFIRPYSDRYLYNHYEKGVQSGGRITYVRLFSIIALFILAIACINFMNLSTAKATGRLKEIGVKKTIGANRTTLIIQYIGESLLIAFSSLLIAIILVILLLPEFNSITGKHLDFVMDSSKILSILGITFLTGIFSGSYPALYLSQFNPVSILKGRLMSSMGELWTRKGLVVFQFIISVILIVFVVIVHKQIDYIQNKNLGLARDHIVRIKRDVQLQKNFDTFLFELKKIPGIVNASNSSGDVTGHHSSTTGGILYNAEKNEFRFAMMDVNFNFFETLGMTFKSGRSFSKEFGSEESAVILNETGVELLGIENPVGKTVDVWGKKMQIVGVVKDFHFESLYDKVMPCFFRKNNPNKDFANNIWVKIAAGRERETLEQMRYLYNEFIPGLEFEYRFLDQDYEKLYESELRVAQLSRYFAGMAVLISCLGLFGLSSFTAEKRRKEISVRKVLGSSSTRIVYLLAGDFTRIVITSMLFSLPISYFLAGHWLNSFAYRIPLDIHYFIYAAIVTLLITWFTIGSQAINAALRNPIDALRNE